MTRTLVALLALVTLATAASNACATSHTVKSGDTCNRILARYPNAYTLNQLYANNPTINKQCTNLKPGQVICVAGGGGGGSPPSPSISGGCRKTHTARAGDICWSIIAKAGISLTSFYQLNPSVHRNCDNLVIGKAYCVDGSPASGMISSIRSTSSMASQASTQSSSTSTSSAPTSSSPPSSSASAASSSSAPSSSAASSSTSSASSSSSASVSTSDTSSSSIPPSASSSSASFSSSSSSAPPSTSSAPSTYRIVRTAFTRCPPGLINGYPFRAASLTANGDVAAGLRCSYTPGGMQNAVCVFRVDGTAADGTCGGIPAGQTSSSPSLVFTRCPAISNDGAPLGTGADTGIIRSTTSFGLNCFYRVENQPFVLCRYLADGTLGPGAVGDVTRCPLNSVQPSDPAEWLDADPVA